MGYATFMPDIGHLATRLGSILKKAGIRVIFSHRAQEIAERDQQAAAWAEEQAEREAEEAAKAAAKASAAAKLAALGLTDEEIAALN